MDQELRGKVALVTGGGSGIGHASALELAKAGASVAILDTVEEAGKAVVAEISGNGGVAHFIRCDVSDRTAISHAFDELMDRFGRLDCAFNNAGIGGPIKPLDQYSDSEWDVVIATNLTSIFACMRREIEIFRSNASGGAIVNCSSTNGHAGVRGMAAYTASKHGIIGLTKAAALEVAQQGIRINAVCPGTIHTPAVDKFIETGGSVAEEFIRTMIAGHPIGRLGTPAEIGQAVRWLCGPSSSFVTGTSLIADGGYLAQ